ncbi:40S ribosomal protein S4 [Capsicum baccatum]|uniref:40S ribosomal protein S4 n=1 Tax=Capsicum baccatum TaxID=33114 RepID=A0A2G2WLQ3_CAPBA|nr:40S ribosomal protein S4 [Capsicum baccatum]
MARGLKKYLKRINAPKHWMLDKLGGAFSLKPSSGPHKSRECLPLIIILRNRLKIDKTYPAGFMDVVSILKTNESFRLLYDTKGRFCLHSLKDEEAKFKLCKVHSVNDTIKLDLESNKIVDFIKFDVENVVMVTVGRNRGRVGVIKNWKKHKG